MAIAVNATKQALANTYAGLGTWISLHTADPGSTGANEATGGSPAYARKQTTWATGANGVKVGSAVTFDVPAGTYTHVGIWTAVTGGTYIDKSPLASPQGVVGPITATGQGQISNTPTFTQS